MSVKIYLDNDFEWDFTLTHRDPNTRKIVPDTGMTNLKGWIADREPTDSEIPPPIHTELSVDATEADQLQGTYYGTHDGDKLRTHLSSYAENTELFFLFGDSANVLTVTKLQLRYKRLV